MGMQVLARHFGETRRFAWRGRSKRRESSGQVGFGPLTFELPVKQSQHRNVALRNRFCGRIIANEMADHPARNPDNCWNRTCISSYVVEHVGIERGCPSSRRLAFARHGNYFPDERQGLGWYSYSLNVVLCWGFTGFRLLKMCLDVTGLVLLYFVLFSRKVDRPSRNAGRAMSPLPDHQR